MYSVKELFFLTKVKKRSYLAKKKKNQGMLYHHLSLFPLLTKNHEIHFLSVSTRTTKYLIKIHNT